ncbi:hypothetical protein ACIRFH_33885 [Streptomyces sp. NPDC093586]|uniref:hypothetical protein n=1 Tax=Streptomyces sp. NPDC093586 TaxID=3366042 RepID=UPI00382817E9
MTEDRDIKYGANYWGYRRLLVALRDDRGSQWEVLPEDGESGTLAVGLWDDR